MTKGASTITMRMDTSAISRMFDSMAVDIEAAARPVASAGAKVLRDEVLANVDAMGEKSGNLRRSIYRVYSKSNSGKGRAVYHISWNYKKAPHGRLLEWGWTQRYQVRKDKSGKWYTLVKPSMRGKPKPSRRASLAEKDRYYVPRKGGPIHWPGRAFVRRATSAGPRAIAAMQEEMAKYVGQI